MNVDTFGTGKIFEDDLVTAIYDLFEVHAADIIEELGLLKPRYEVTAAYDHLGYPEMDLPSLGSFLDKVRAFEVIL